MTTMVERMAAALRDAANEFDAPVWAYVESEAHIRWMKENPGKSSYDDAPLDIDFEAESWKILVRAVLQAMREPTDAVLIGLSPYLSDYGAVSQDAAPMWRDAIDAALKEGT